MGKKSKSKNKVKNVLKKNDTLPYVSICTPTFNRRPFFEALIQCVANQDYDHSKIEWIVVDDGTDCIKDVFENESHKDTLKDIKVRYFYENEKMDLGKKRNYMHEKCEFKGDEDIIVYMDDDDFYPKDRVSHSVTKLVSNPNALCGGASEIFLWFNSLNKMYKFGPYGPNHGTAGTFAFKRKLLKDTSYENSAILAEEKHFLKNYTVPFVQFDPMKTILVVSHEQNTFDKKRLVNKANHFCKESALQVKDFIKDDYLRNFYHSHINELLKTYEPGDVKNKPKVLEEIKRRDMERESMAENRPSGISIGDSHGNRRDLSIKDVKTLIQTLQAQNDHFKKKEMERQALGENRPSGIVVTEGNDASSNRKELTIREIKEFMMKATQENSALKIKLKEYMEKEKANNFADISNTIIS